MALTGRRPTRSTPQSPTATDVALEVRTAERAEGVIVMLGGKLLADEVRWSRAVLDAVVDGAEGDITVDCSDLTYADCGGWAALFGAQRRATGLGLRIWIRGVFGQPLAALQRSGFIDLFPIDRRSPDGRTLGPQARRA